MTTKVPGKLFSENLSLRLITCYRVNIALQKTLERYAVQSVPDLSYALEHLSWQEARIISEMALVRDRYKDNCEPSEPIKQAHGVKVISFMLGLIGMGHMVWLRFVVTSVTKTCGGRHDSVLGPHQGALLRTIDSLMQGLSDSSDELAAEITASKLAQMDALICARGTVVSDSTSPWEFSVASTAERWRQMTLASRVLSIENFIEPTETLFIAAFLLFPLGTLLVKAFRTLPQIDLSDQICKDLEALVRC